MLRVVKKSTVSADSTQPEITASTRRELRESRGGRVVSKAARSPKIARASRAPRAKRDPNAPKNPLTTITVMLVTGGMFLAAGLPAYAATGEIAGDKSDPLVAAPQTVVVDDAVLAAAVVREQFSATTHEELEAAKRIALMQARQPGPRQAGDDYPWRDANTTSLSPLRYVYRQCVDFVVWRLNRDAGSVGAPWKYDWGNLTPGGGNARQWYGQWQAKGWPYSNTPIVGSIAYTGANHLAYVKEVYADGSVFLEEYNYVPDQYSTRIVHASEVNVFLYPPPF